MTFHGGSQRAVSVILENWPFTISPFWQKYPFNFSDVLHKESFSLHLFPNMFNFNVVDFSEHPTEEVISFFWRSVYIDDTEAYVRLEEFQTSNAKWDFFYFIVSYPNGQKNSWFYSHQLVYLDMCSKWVCGRSNGKRFTSHFVWKVIQSRLDWKCHIFKFIFMASKLYEMFDHRNNTSNSL